MLQTEEERQCEIKVKMAESQLSLLNGHHALPAHPTPYEGLFMPDLIFLLTPTPPEITAHLLRVRQCGLREVE